MSDRIVANPEVMQKNWRVAMFALINMFLATQRAMSSDGELGPTEILIYATIATANIQKLMRERAIPDGFTGTQVLPREWVVPISRNAIAETSGLPRETVRRNVEQMIARGLLMEDERGGVTSAPGMIQARNLEPILGIVLGEFVRAFEALLRARVVEIVREPAEGGDYAVTESEARVPDGSLSTDSTPPA